MLAGRSSTPDALVGEAQRVGLAVIESRRLHDAGAHHLVEEGGVIRASLMAPMPFLSASPESTMPYCFILATE